METFNYVAVIILMMLGLWAMIAKKNIIKKLIGMAIFQTGIILFYISMGAKKGSSIPILEHGHHDGHREDHNDDNHDNDVGKNVDINNVLN